MQSDGERAFRCVAARYQAAFEQQKFTISKTPPACQSKIVTVANIRKMN
jgi:hypothetical protein